MVTWPPRPCLLQLTRSHVLLWLRSFKLTSSPSIVIESVPYLPHAKPGHFWIRLSFLFRTLKSSQHLSDTWKPDQDHEQRTTITTVRPLAWGLECIQMHALQIGVSWYAEFPIAFKHLLLIREPVLFHIDCYLPTAGHTQLDVSRCRNRSMV